MAPPPGKRGSGKPRADKSSRGGSRPGKPGGGKPTGGRPSGSKRPIAAGGPPKRRPRPASAGSKPPAGGEPRGERLQKVLAAAGLASRRECEEYITEGRVQVDGEVVTELGARVDRAKQEIKVDGEPLPRIRLQYFAVHKPPGIVSTARDPSGRPRVIDLLPPGVGRMFNVGRLDMASEGLILVTNDGPLADQLTHPRHGVEKIYEVTVAGQPDAEVLAQVKRGVHLSDGFVHAVDVRIKSSKKGATLLEMVLDEGRNREVRRLLARLGHKVQRLIRVAVGPVRLGELPRGAVRMLTPEEVKKLREAAAAGPRDDADDNAPRRRPGRGPGGPKRAPMRGNRPPAATGKPPGGRKLIGGRPAAGKAHAKKRPPIGGTEPVRSVIGDGGASAAPPARPATPDGKPPRKAFGGKKPGRPGAFKKKVGHQKGQGGRGKPKPGGKR
jgi:23S rRNA pseudouridine2605 synthase